ncbi:YadA-like family protein [uncultured Endozoicomonas sp.]|uniref:YadA C-terminal domain-containing protein n=1 Tax=uncultured Endozoicomonas sp. TaxID=432652 RepID=UPI00260F7627|nr:YadA-like family protein [uncultured Endozoicomonas sp.]
MRESRKFFITMIITCLGIISKQAFAADFRSTHETNTLSQKTINHLESRVGENQKGVQFLIQHSETNQKLTKINAETILKVQEGATRNEQKIAQNKDILKSLKKITHNTDQRLTDVQKTLYSEGVIRAKQAAALHKKQISGMVNISQNSQDIEKNRLSLQSLEALNERRLSDMHNKVEKNNKIALSGIAQSMAQAALPQASGGNNMIGMGAGNYGGQSAVAIGMSSNFGDQHQYTVNARASFSSTKHGAAVGIGMAF